MPESTSNSPPQELSFPGAGQQWSPEAKTDMQNNTVEWTEALPQNIPAVSSSMNYVPNGIVTSIGYNSPNYVNIAYPRNLPNIPSGYTPIIPNQPDLLQNQPMLVQRLNGHKITKNWTNQPALGRLVQSTSWNAKPQGVKKQKRIRTAFTSHQMMELEQEYSRTRYLDRTRRMELANILRLNERTIKIWFQNRRMKEKKDRAESLEDIEEVTASPPEVMVLHEQFPSNDTFRPGVFVEHYPVAPMPVPIQPMPQVIAPVSYPPPYPMTEECNQYQQVHIQLQQYPSPYGSEVQESSPESTIPSDSSLVTQQSDLVDKSWDLSWIRSIEAQDDF